MPDFLLPLQKYAQFNGRSRRMETWPFLSAVIVLMCVLLYAVKLSGGTGLAGGHPTSVSSVLIAVLGLASLSLASPSLAAATRRLHDTNRSGLWLLLILIPFLGGLVLVGLMLLDGTPGPNRFGDDPKGRSAQAAETVLA